METTHDVPAAQEYIRLRVRTGMGFRERAMVEVALANSLFIVSLRNEGELIASGRVAGDQGLTFVITDIMVDPDYQGKGYGKLIMKEIDDYLEKNTDQHAYVCLIANKPADKLYAQFGFDYIEPDSCGMKRRQTVPTKATGEG